MNIELKKLKTHEDMSDETLCFSAEVWVDGRAIAYANNQGTGGENNYHVIPDMKPAWDKVLDHVKAQPAHEYQGITLPYSIDQLIDELIAKQEERKQLKRWCKTQTVFRLKGDQPGSWRTVKSIFTPAVKEYMVKKYGNTIETIANEDTA